MVHQSISSKIEDDQRYLCIETPTVVMSENMNGEKFADVALNKHGVALVPGTSFGDSPTNYIRVSSANSLDNLSKSIKRLASI